MTYRVLSGFITRVNGSYNDGGTTLTNLIWADSDNGSTGALQAFSRGSIPRRSTILLMLRASVMVARWAHNPEGRFDSEATQPKKICRTTDSYK